MAVFTSTSSSPATADQEKFLAADLISRTMLKLVCAQACKKVKQKDGTGTTAYFARYKRMNVPIVPLSETGADPSSSSFSVDQVSVALDQWGDLIEVTDIAILAQFHPILEEMTELLADNAQRVIDREIQVVWLAGTTIQYYDGSQTARNGITSAMVLTTAVIQKAKVTLSNNGAPPFTGPDSNSANDAKQYGQIKSVRQGNAYLAITSPGVMEDVMSISTSFGTFVAVATYADDDRMFNAEVGQYRGFRWIESNFLPSFQLLGTTTTAASATSLGITTLATATSGGALSDATYYLKVTKKDLLRGFEEFITIEHTYQLSGGGSAQTIALTFPSTAGFAWSWYAGSSSGDANLFVVASNVAAGTLSTLTTAIPSTGANPPASIHGTGTTDPTSIQVIYCIGNGFCGWVTLQNLQFMITKDESVVGAALKLKRQAGYKYMSKAVILDQNKGLRIEIASTFV